MSEIMTRDEHAVGYVEDWRWSVALVGTIIAILVMTSEPAGERFNAVTVEYAVLGLLFVLSVLVSYPYIHYRLQGGQFQRIPPRYIHYKQFLPAK